MKKCIVIGSKGYIGKHIVFYLKQMGIEPICYDLNEDEVDNCYKIDLTDRNSFRSIDLNVDFIFFFSGLTGTLSGFELYEKFVSINEIGLLNFLDHIRRSPFRPKIIFPSTRLVYEGVDRPLKENDTKETKTIYAVNKLASEGILQAYKASFDIPYTIFRICVPYGNLFENDYSYGLIGFFVKMASSGKDITLYGDGNLKRTFTHVEDICYQIINAAFNKDSNGQVYNVGGVTYKLKEAAKIVSLKYNTSIRYVDWPEMDLRIESNHTYFDDTKIQSIIGVLTYKRLESINIG